MSNKLILPKKEIVMFLESGKTISDAVAKFGFSKSTLKRNKIFAPKNKAGYTQYKKDFNYFKEINTQNKAYILGLLMADGCIKSTYELSIESKDEILPDFVRRELCPNYKIKYIKRNRCQFKSISETYYFGLKTKEWFIDLKQWGIIPNKTYSTSIKVPSIPFRYLKDFIRGYFDGDGSIYRTGTQTCVSFTGNKYLLQSVKKYLNIFDIGINNKISEKKNQFDAVYKFSSKKDLELFYNLIYKNANYYLPRKYQRFISLARLKPFELLENPEEDNQQRSFTGK